jgi:hypothetical protein
LENTAGLYSDVVAATVINKLASTTTCLENTVGLDSDLLGIFV